MPRQSGGTGSAPSVCSDPAPGALQQSRATAFLEQLVDCRVDLVLKDTIKPRLREDPQLGLSKDAFAADDKTVDAVGRRRHLVGRDQQQARGCRGGSQRSPAGVRCQSLTPSPTILPSILLRADQVIE
jgi:hypothetical protein